MKQLFVMLLLLCSVVANAQDVIVKKDGSLPATYRPATRRVATLYPAPNSEFSRSKLGV